MKKFINWLLIIGMLVCDVYYIIDALQTQVFSRFATYLALIPLLCLPTIFRKVFHMKISESLELVYLIFIFLAQFLGSVVNLYSKVEWFDTFTHGLSGILTCFLALIILVKFRQDPTKKIIFHATYILGIVFLVASLWEFFEFGMDQFTGSNLQHWMETGVEDTMIDILSAFIGGMTFLLYYVFEMLSKKDGFLHQFIKSI